jgi:hypothetical protein
VRSQYVTSPMVAEADGNRTRQGALAPSSVLKTATSTRHAIASMPAAYGIPTDYNRARLGDHAIVVSSALRNPRFGADGRYIGGEEASEFLDTLRHADINGGWPLIDLTTGELDPSFHTLEHLNLKGRE